MSYNDVVSKAINKRLLDWEEVMRNGNDFDSAVASLVVMVLKDLEKEVC